MRAYEKLKLNDYMGRQNYLSRFNSRDEILEELEYIRYRLNQDITILVRAILELKCKDLKTKLMGV